MMKDIRFCPRCRSQIIGRFCGNCGFDTQMPPGAVVQRQKAKKPPESVEHPKQSVPTAPPDPPAIDQISTPAAANNNALIILISIMLLIFAAGGDFTGGYPVEKRQAR